MKLISTLIAVFVGKMLLDNISRQAADSIDVSFQRVKVGKFSLQKTVLEFSMVITNKTVLPMALKSVNGVLSLGLAQTSFFVDQALDIPAGKTGILNFSIVVNNGDFLIQLGDQLASEQWPKLNFRGTINAGFSSSRTIALPVNQNIPIQIL